MSLFNPRKNKDKWASIVVANATPGMQFDDAFLEASTTLYIQQHTRILYDCIRLVCTSKNKQTRKDRYDLACKKYGALTKVRKYANKDQKKLIDRAIDDFIKMQDLYKHPNKQQVTTKVATGGKQSKNEFWEAYGIMEMIDIFMDDLESDLFGKGK